MRVPLLLVAAIAACAGALRSPDRSPVAPPMVNDYVASDDGERWLRQGNEYIDRIHTIAVEGGAAAERAGPFASGLVAACAREASATINLLVRPAELHLTALKLYVQRRDRMAAEAEHIKISNAFNKAEELEGQLKCCMDPCFESGR